MSLFNLTKTLKNEEYTRNLNDRRINKGRGASNTPAKSNCLINNKQFLQLNLTKLCKKFWKKVSGTP